MKLIRRIAMFLLILFSTSGIVQAWTVPTTYEESIFELRGSWVSTVSNLDIGQQISIEQYKQQYQTVLNTFESFAMNAVFFQVRPTNDAFYESEINPWSRFLTGRQGLDPGWDPLPWLIEETHKRGMEFHAWLNPYRVTLDVFSTSVKEYLRGIPEVDIPYWHNKYLTEQYQPELNAALSSLDDKNFAKQHPELLIQGGVRILLNPAKEEVREHIYQTISEIITKYDVDAIHFDDYFYNDVSFVSDKDLFLEDTQATGYNLAAHKDWRRHQVDLLVEGIDSLIETFNLENQREVQFGISPAGGWAPSITECSASSYGMEGGMEGYPCTGYSSYHDLFADTRKWVKEEWLDYILPQNYFELGRYHEAISDWWSRQVEGTSVKLYMGLGIYQLNNYTYLTSSEYIRQLRFNHSYTNIKGIVFFSYRNLLANSGEMKQSNDLIKTYWTRQPLLPAAVQPGIYPDVAVDQVLLTRRNQKAMMEFAAVDGAIGYAIYRSEVGQIPVMNASTIRQIIPAGNDIIFYEDQVENDDVFDYHIKVILSNGNLSALSKKVNMGEIFINNEPQILHFNLSGSNIYSPMDKIVITGTFEDANQDALTAVLEYAYDGVRYRHSIPIEVIDNEFSVEFYPPQNYSKTALFRLSVSDPTATTQSHSKTVYIVESGMNMLDMQLYYALDYINEQMKAIMGLAYGD